MESLCAYAPPTTNIKLTLFKAEKLLPENKNINDSHNHLQNYSNDIDVCSVPGNHDTMLLEPNIEILADKLRNHLKIF